MGHETCQILGQVSHNLLYWKKNLLMDICGPGGDGQIISGQKSGNSGKERQAEGEAKVVT